MITSILLMKILGDNDLGFYKVQDRWITLRHDSTLYERHRIQGFADFTPGSNNSYMIVIDSNMVTKDKDWGDNVYRFILAHEIGHVILGHVDDRKGDAWWKERAADCYAVKELDAAGIPGLATAISYYKQIIDHPRSGRPGGIDHIAFVKSCDN